MVIDDLNTRKMLQYALNSFFICKLIFHYKMSENFVVIGTILNILYFYKFRTSGDIYRVFLPTLFQENKSNNTAIKKSLRSTNVYDNI